MTINPSIFGVLAPKIAYGSNNILYDYVTVIRDEPEWDGAIRESAINSTRNLISNGDHWAFDVMINLFKYADPLTKFTQINAARYQEVTLWRRRDRDPFKDSSGTIVKFFITEIIPVYLDRWDKPDQLIIKHISKKYVDISKSTLSTLTDGDDEYLIDGDDEYLL